MRLLVLAFLLALALGRLEVIAPYSLKRGSKSIILKQLL